MKKLTGVKTRVELHFGNMFHNNGEPVDSCGVKKFI